MKEAGKAIRRVVDGVEDAVEHVLKGEEEEHEHRHRHHGGHTSTGPVTVNVNIDCCCPPKGPSGPPQPPGTRPPHVTGTSDGTLPGGVVDPGGIIGIVSRPPDVWPGPRDHLYMPFLFIRANAGDLGARPVVGPFWESPDILIEPGIDPAHAPAIPTSLGAIAKAGMDNTLYAHVWNLGQAPCPDTLVEFYWFNPALGFDAAHANLVGATWVELRARGEANSHRLVRCPVSWRAQFVNGGHECLMVRLSQAALDPLSAPAWDASRNRHIGQRNIHVMSAAEAAAKPTLAIGVGPLFGGNAAVAVQRANTGTMPWLHLVTMDRNRTPGTGAANGDVGLTPPTPEGAPLPNLGAVPDPRGAGLIGDSHGVAGDGQQVGFHATDGNPGAGQAHVYRVTGTQNGALFGGYTVVVLGE
ncbi:MAG: hypothetical protein E6J05_03285 [Chloroflexi bacterium]|nr:MAG: hypothetical protein E6J05_03285 [Chloroflexota bacterium]